jgi:hypothetical protein
LRQPLLKNFWIDPARATIKINRVNLRISEEQLAPDDQWIRW